MIKKTPTNLSFLEDNATVNKAKQRTNINALFESCSMLCVIFLALRVEGCGNKSFLQSSPYGEFIMCDQSKP